MMKTIAERIKELRHDSIYKVGAERFQTTYKYVWQVAHGRRKATRGKGRDIKEWLEMQLKK